MPLIASIAVTTGLVAWVVLTVATNIPRVDLWIYRTLKLGWAAIVIPSWAFFAPRPVNSDCALLYRDRYDSGTVGLWTEVRELTTARTWLTVVWHPDSRPKKALSDAVSHVARLVRDSDARPDVLVLHAPYLLLLNYVTSLERAAGVTGRQFAVVRYSLVDERPVPVLVSHMHDLPKMR
jgi:hypothetical protein